MSGPMGNGTVEIVDVERSLVVGYGYIEDGISPDAQQVQRWVLYADYKGPPARAVLFRQPSEPARRYARLDDWTHAVRDGGLWKTGARYVKVDCVSYDKITSMPPPSGEQQLDDGACALYRGDVLVGAVFTTGMSAEKSREDWVFFNNDVPSSSVAMLVGPPRTSYPTLNDFLSQMSAGWKTGNVYVVCTCTPFTTLPDQL